MALTIPPLFYIMLFNGEGTLCPCGNACGLLVPLAVNGTYDNPNGGGVVRFNLTNSPGGCGISIARVLSGNLMDLEGRDDFVELNPNSKSMRMRIDVSNRPPSSPFHELTCAKSGPAMKSSRQRSAYE